MHCYFTYVHRRRLPQISVFIANEYNDLTNCIAGTLKELTPPLPPNDLKDFRFLMWNYVDGKGLVSALNLSFLSCTIMRTHSRRIEPNLVAVDEGRMGEGQCCDDHT